jgi:hypothetical protein
MMEVVPEPAVPAVERSVMPAEASAPESGVTESAPGTVESTATHPATTAASTTTSAAASPSASGDGYRREYEDCQQDESDREDGGLLPHVFFSYGAMSRVCASYRGTVKPCRINVARERSP